MILFRVFSLIFIKVKYGTCFSIGFVNFLQEQ